MKRILKRHLTISDILLIAANLVPIWGVWFMGWDAKMMFLVYCMESIIIGLYNILQMWLVTLVKKENIVANNVGSKKKVSGYVYMLFFLVHYGFFIFVQMKIFLGSISINGLKDEVFTFLFHFNKFMPSYALWVLLLFAFTYGLVVVKDFVLPGVYKTIDMTTLLFAPYGRIFIQQFVVIVGSFVLQFNKEGKIFILVFVLVKVFFEQIIDYKKLIAEAAAKQNQESKS